jgi:hypothetical protein
MTNPIQGEERKGAKTQRRKEEMGIPMRSFPFFQPPGMSDRVYSVR